MVAELNVDWISPWVGWVRLGRFLHSLPWAGLGENNLIIIISHDHNYYSLSCLCKITDCSEYAACVIACLP